MSYSNPQRIINKQFSELDKLSEKFNDTSEGYFNLVQPRRHREHCRHLKTHRGDGADAKRE